jgi:regulator of cell morphogenesis and NO signaling
MALADALFRTRELTRDLQCPADACPTWRALYAGLAELEEEIHMHAHVENNFLFLALPEA